MCADTTQLTTLKDIFYRISKSTKLLVNYNNHLLSQLIFMITGLLVYPTFGVVEKDTMFFTYLGLPMRTTGPRIDDLMPIVSGMDNKLSNTACMLTYVGRLIHMKSVISFRPIFCMWSIKV